MNTVPAGLGGPFHTMTPPTHTPYGSPVPSTSSPTVASLLVVPLLLVTLLVVASYPLYAAAFFACVLAGLGVLQRGLAAHVRRTADRVREFDIPGVGTVRFRVTPR